MRSLAQTTRETRNGRDHVQITVNEFLTNRKQLLVYSIAGFLDIPPESVKIQSVEEGSAKVFVRLDAEAASRLLQAHRLETRN